MLCLENSKKGEKTMSNQFDNENEQLKQLAAKMKEAEYKGLSEKEIKEREKQKETLRVKNIQILNDTLDVCSKGENLHFNLSQMCEAEVFLPDDIDHLREKMPNKRKPSVDCKFACENTDTLVLAQKKYEMLKQNSEEPKILVLNMASASEPGGKTRNGADAQEEELCRRTSLLLSLESEKAKEYYTYNNSHKTRLGSDAALFSPNVEVIKDSQSKLLSKPFSISVISSSAPMVRLGFEGKTKQEYEEMLYKRIQNILIVAEKQNYKHLILGAFGCGIFGNDAALVSDLFKKAFNETPCNFETVDFAVFCKPEKDYNYKEFCRNFSSRK